MPQFEFIVPGSPFSANNAKKNPKGHQRWKERVRGEAERQWTTDGRTEPLPINVPLGIVITTFFTELEKDVDNVLKPILDSLKQPEVERQSPFPGRTFALYSDDRLVYRLMSEKVDLKVSTTFDRPSPLLLDALDRGYPEFVDIVVQWDD